MRSKNIVPRISGAALLFGLALALAPLSTARAQGASDILTNFPDSQVVVYVNAQRIINEAAPRIVPQQKLDETFEKMKREAMGFDVRSVHHVAAGVRFRGEPKPGAMPEFLVIVKGDFDANALLSLVRMGMPENVTEETYGSRTINIFKMSRPKPAEGGAQPEPAAAEAQKPSPPFPELAVVLFDANTVAVGVPDYVRAAIDAESQTDARLNSGLLELATRNAGDLFSLVGNVPEGFVKHLPGGASQNAELSKILGSIRQLQASVGMTETDFPVQSTIRTDTPESARAISGMIAIGLRAAEAGIQKDLDKTPTTKVNERRGMESALAIVRAMTNNANGNEVTLATAISQKAVAGFVQNELNRKAAKPKPTTRRTTRRRGVRRT
ncbi:MAG TPA: hypothetical protein VFX96_11615 [Pyrinomonadaceae bacterium]|nr:hypothetical protein [Pyrinomonadaceae bacterium]